MDRTLPPKIRELRQMEIQPPRRSILPNGVPLNVIDAGDCEVMRIDLLMPGGRWQQTAPLQALFTNRMLREGTHRYTAARLAEQLDYYGAWLELSAAAEHSFVTLYTLNKYLPQTLDVLESVIKEPLFPDERLQVVIDNNVQQFKVNCSKVDFLAHRRLMQCLFGRLHPSGRLVEEEDYRRITAPLLRSFYRSHYHSQGCVIYLSGRVTDEACRRVERIFGTEPFGQVGCTEPAATYQPQSDAGKRFFIPRQGALQSAVRMGSLAPDRHHPDFLKLRVLVTLLGGYFGSRLMSNIREEKGYTYGIGASLVPYPGHSVLVINSETANEYVNPLIAEVYRELERLQNEPVSDAELAMVRNYLLGELCRNYESPFSLADAWIFVHTSRFPDTHFADSLQAIKETTSDDIRRLAQLYLCKETLKEVVSGEKMP